MLALFIGAVNPLATKTVAVVCALQEPLSPITVKNIGVGNTGIGNIYIYVSFTSVSYTGVPITVIFDC